MWHWAGLFPSLSPSPSPSPSPSLSPSPSPSSSPSPSPSSSLESNPLFISHPSSPFLQIEGLPGTYIANQYLSGYSGDGNNVRTLISFDGGAKWNFIAPPSEILSNGQLCEPVSVLRDRSTVTLLKSKLRMCTCTVRDVGLHTFKDPPLTFHPHTIIPLVMTSQCMVVGSGMVSFTVHSLAS